jgi:hypothetical protein
VAVVADDDEDDYFLLKVPVFVYCIKITTITQLFLF